MMNIKYRNLAFLPAVLLAVPAMLSLGQEPGSDRLRPAPDTACPAAGSEAQIGSTFTPSRPARMSLNDGSEILGSVEAEEPDTVRFRTAGGLRLAMPRSQIRSIILLPGRFEGGKYLRPDPNYTRLLFAPTARPLKSGQGYFSAYEVFFPFLAYGVGDHLTLAGGMSLFPGASAQLFYLAPKATVYNSEKLSLAGGVLYLNATKGFEEFEGAGIVYGVSTYGSGDRAVTGGLGWGFFGDDFANDPILMLGGELRLSNSVKLVTENWFPPKSEAYPLSLGVRFFGDRLAADIALIYPAGVETEGFPFMPWLGFAYNFGAAEQKGGR
jgi:hypothetical protein